jgi:hypothetical protein
MSASHAAADALALTQSAVSGGFRRSSGGWDWSLLDEAGSASAD